jgi:ribosomal protein S4
LIKKKFNLKNNKSFFYSVHVASPQKKIKKWSNFGLKKIYYKKVSLFLGFKKVSSFVNFYKKTARFWGENEFFLFSLLERRLESFVLRSNLINSIYFIKKFIENGNVMINNIMVTNPLRILQLGEIVSINKKYSKLMYFSLKSRLLKRKVILNFPDFIELDYKLLVGMVIRPPSFASLTKPVSFDLYTSFLSVNNH